MRLDLARAIEVFGVGALQHVEDRLVEKEVARIAVARERAVEIGGMVVQVVDASRRTRCSSGTRRARAGARARCDRARAAARRAIAELTRLSPNAATTAHRR